MLPSFPELLELAGFTLRGRSRATCAYCSGRSRATVNYRDNVAYCHRCQWSTGYFKLARELKILESKLTAEDLQELEQKRIYAENERRFYVWRGERLKEIVYKIQDLNRYARLAREVLREFPNEEHALQALANLYNGEAELCAAYDFFNMEKVSNWREQDSTLQEVVALWKYDETGRF